MIGLIRLASCSLMLLQALVAGSPVPEAAVPRYFKRNPHTPAKLDVATLQKELGPTLSKGSLIFGPKSSNWADSTDRWNLYAIPDVKVVVQPAAESDVSKIVKFCNEYSIEFLARTRGHGITKSLNAFKGLEIDLSQLQAVTIQPGGKTALMQGGVWAAPVVESLWEQGYVTTTGSAPCVGVVGPGLGGGHGRYEGLYGLVSDSFVHLNVVLADGTQVGVNATSHADLFWAMQGAGHNFGIVTSMIKKIEPRQIDTWHTHSYIWAPDKIETVFNSLNAFHTSYNGTTPPKMGVAYGVFVMNASISQTEAVMSFRFHYAGPAAEAEKLLAPFNKIGSIYEETSDVSYPTIVAGEQVACGSAQYVFSSALTLTYNVTTERTLWKHFNKKVAQYPELAATAVLMHEGYATAGVQAVPFKSTAYPHREANHILYFDTQVPVGKSSTLLAPATQWAKEATDIWNAGQPTRQPTVYVNYAIGNAWESVQQIYGPEAWRLKKLRQLKAKYDPNNSFRYFVPIES